MKKLRFPSRPWPAKPPATSPSCKRQIVVGWGGCFHHHTTSPPPPRRRGIFRTARPHVRGWERIPKCPAAWVIGHHGRANHLYFVHVFQRSFVQCNSFDGGIDTKIPPIVLQSGRWVATARSSGRRLFWQPCYLFASESRPEPLKTLFTPFGTGAFSDDPEPQAAPRHGRGLALDRAGIRSTPWDDIEPE